MSGVHRSPPSPPSTTWLATGAAMMGVLIGGAAVYFGLQSQRVSDHPQAVVAAQWNDADSPVPSKPEPTEMAEPVVAASSGSVALADVVGQTRDAVVNLATAQGLGAGVIVHSSGIVLTNYHVIADALRSVETLPALTDKRSRPGQLTARFENAREVPAVVVVADREQDLAVLRLVSTDPKEEFAAARLGQSSQLRVGDGVFAIGNPFGLHHTVSRGIVSALNRTGILDNASLPVIQLDASINLGNSGGPLFSLQGELMGIITARRRQAEGIAFALPVDHVRGFLRAVEDPNASGSGVMGVGMDPDADLLPNVERLGFRAGLRLVAVYDSSPAHQAGLRVGDTIVALRGTRLDGLPKRDPESLVLHLQDTVRSMFSGEKLALTVVRGDQSIDTEVEIGSASPLDQAFIDAEEMFGLVLDRRKNAPTIAQIRRDAAWSRFAKPLQDAKIVRIMGREIPDVHALGQELRELRELSLKQGDRPTVILGVRTVDGRVADLPIRVR